jgi:hypothetical protein
MAAVALTVREYNDLRVQAALRPALRVMLTPQAAPEPAAHREIPGRAETPSGTRINTGDSEGVSVTPGRPGGRPRRHASTAEGNRARQRAYRARQRSHLAPGAGAR